MAKIAACLIVRNSAVTIERTIQTIRPYVDEINVFDTGSTDETVSMLRTMNRTKTWQGTDPAGGKVKVPLAPIRVEVAKKREIPLSEDGLLGDFSWAREQSFRMASDDCDWMFWLDDDDVIVGAEHLRPLAARAHPSLDGYVMFYDYAQDEQGRNVCALWRERLIRRKPADEWGWRNAVHEVWLPHEHTGVHPNYLMVPMQQIKFVHQRPPARYPSTRNIRILERVIADAQAAGGEPDPRTKAYMGTELMAQGQFPGAIPWLNAYLEDARTSPGDERSQVFHKLAACLRVIGQPLAAIEVEFSAIKERGQWAENAVGLCEAYAEIGDWAQCEEWATTALRWGQPQSMLILNPLEFSLVPLIRLAQAKMAQKKYEEAAPIISQAAAIQPSNPLVLETAAACERDGLREQVVQAILKIREVNVRFDENWKAYELLTKAVPYIVADDPRIVSARAMQTENVRHALEPDEYTRWYEDEPKESTVPDEWVPNAGDFIERAKFTLELCQRFEEEHGRKPRVLDLGCNDAWMLGYLWTNGEFYGDGIELNKASVEKAQGRIERFGIPGKIAQGNIFDALKLLGPWESAGNEGYDIVSCFEVYEHVPDTDQLLAVMESLLTPDGIACVTTPNGAFEDGNLAMWQIVERKGHLRAVTALELASQLGARGTIDTMRVHNGGALTFAAWRPSPKVGKVIVFAPGAYEEWSAESINTTGIGGSETCLVYLVLGLAARGYDVRVYSDAKPGVIGNSIWRPSGAFDPTEKADAVIVSRAPHAFDVDIHAPVRALWCHDATYGDTLTKKRAERITHLVALSDWSAEAFEAEYDFLEGKTVVVRNGVSLTSQLGVEKFPNGDRGFDERKPVCIYSSSADRGLDKLLEVWPQIRFQVPDAELHVYYGFETMDKAISVGRADLAQFRQNIAILVERCNGEEGGVFMKGRVGQSALYEAMQDARVWTYPTYFTETSCITALEARAAGLACVTTELAALNETLGGHGLRLPLPQDQFYMDGFVAATVKMLTEPIIWERWHDAALDGIEECSWSARITDWERLVLGVEEHLPVEYAHALKNA
jgi:glycosyltransferase involved in cell wall biosynthesis/tetratricopeptide (TPR) repeat protein